jgi:hypothetical protein
MDNIPCPILKYGPWNNPVVFNTNENTKSCSQNGDSKCEKQNKWKITRKNKTILENFILGEKVLFI